MKLTTSQIRAINYASDGLTTTRVASVCTFCQPFMRPPVVKRIKDESQGDIAVINLRRSFEAAEAVHKFYDSYEQYLECLQMYIAGSIAETGIYTNITWSDWALSGALNGISRSAQ